MMTIMLMITKMMINRAAVPTPTAKYSVRFVDEESVSVFMMPFTVPSTLLLNFAEMYHAMFIKMVENTH